MSEWQPIETAPHEEILVWDGTEINIADFERIFGVWVAVRCVDGLNLIPQPTHWMPLPDEPK